MCLHSRHKNAFAPRRTSENMNNQRMAVRFVFKRDVETNETVKPPTITVYHSCFHTAVEHTLSHNEERAMSDSLRDFLRRTGQVYESNENTKDHLSNIVNKAIAAWTRLNNQRMAVRFVFKRAVEIDETSSTITIYHPGIRNRNEMEPLNCNLTNERETSQEIKAFLENECRVCPTEKQDIEMLAIKALVELLNKQLARNE